MERTNSVVGIYSAHQQAEEAIFALRDGGFDPKKLSIVGRGYHPEEQVVGYYNTGDRMKSWGQWGAFWGAVWGWVMGAALFFVPGIGPVLVAGPLVAAIVAALEGAVVVGGLSALGGALVSLGIPKDSVLRYETALKADRFLVIAHGTDADVEKAREILGRTSAQSLDVHKSSAPPAEPVPA